jgi:hypothetical protein
MSILPTSSERRDPPVTDSGAPAAVRSPHELTKRERYREIIAVLARHGFGIVDDRMLKHEKAGQARAEHLRLACEELGTLFIKLGQVLSTRSDILAPAYRAELVKMQDDVPPLPTQLIAEVIEEDLGASPDEIFSRFDDTPLGSASIGQVHAARLTDGREVVVKVRKPGVDEVVRASTSRSSRAWSTSGRRTSPRSSSTTPRAYSASSATPCVPNWITGAKRRTKNSSAPSSRASAASTSRTARAVHAQPRSRRRAYARTTGLRGGRPGRAAPGGDLPAHRPLRGRAGAGARRLLRRPAPGQPARRGRRLALGDRLRQGRPPHARAAAARD